MMQLYYTVFSSIATVATEGLVSVIETLPKFLTPYISDIIMKVVVIATKYCVQSCDP